MTDPRGPQWRPTDHTCHWPGCKEQVPPKLWGCKSHWFKLPKYLRDKIWACYVPGQEQRKDPSPAYIDAANMVQEWIAANFKPVKKKPQDQTNAEWLEEYNNA